MRECKNCEKKIKDLTDQNYSLHQLVEVLKSELNDRVETIEDIKLELVKIHKDEKSAKDIVYKLISKIVK